VAALDDHIREAATTAGHTSAAPPAGTDWAEVR
jgi:hypothetical protein